MGGLNLSFAQQQPPTGLLLSPSHPHSRPVLHHPVPKKNLPILLRSNNLPIVPCPESLFLALKHTAATTATTATRMNQDHSQLPEHPEQQSQSPTPPPPPAAASRKRSPSLAFAGASPPSSRPPSRSHTARRVRAKRAAERPPWVTEKEGSIGLAEHMGDVLVDVLWPGADQMDVGRRVGGLRGRGRVTVLAFLGCTLEHLVGLGHVAALLASGGADVFGVSLSAPPPGTSTLPVIHDVTRALTLALGLLHPLGGGRQALDAIVVLDRDSLRRMVLPVGWGPRLAPGQRDEENGEGVSSVVGRCVKGVEWLGNEAVDQVVEDVEMGMAAEVVGVAV
ncbi:hypothetical protein DFP73DRAFT_242274 [Morchella snyderi]|nr:hypothetical protein DFP73DRAFT_242274 [Morchella snyderi]